MHVCYMLYIFYPFLAISDLWCFELSALKKEIGIEFYEDD